MAEITGTNGNDNLEGGDEADVIIGLRGDDRMRGFGGRDVLFGYEGDDYLIDITDAGLDLMYGGLGDDTYEVASNVGTNIIEFSGEGIDTVLSRGSFSLDSDEGFSGVNNLNNLVLIGDGNADGTGNSGRNRIEGNDFDNILEGRGDIDTLIGNGGNDTLIGGPNKDFLTGGDGNDIFVFSNPGSGNNIITDYNVSNDTIRIIASTFGGGLEGGVDLTEDQFVIGSRAIDAQSRFLYTKEGKGSLYFDVDGTGPVPRILIADLDAGLDISAAEFQIV